MNHLANARAAAVLDLIIAAGGLTLDGYGMGRLRFDAGATSRQVEDIIERLAADGLIVVEAKAGRVTVEPAGGAR
ncbi:hypothetical protein [Solidesulfovibrio magneticus]|uniref:Uncharacterized protein n=1 Tax=Solidesulfovibrio magneticus (strain ATCC 700980 / DSM 13731 / RS-1) TaxID=573370 RepID=C4XKK1_SOLM1|nr:hypothetical protein [Solidesulfovibrio magneticus]BAH76941.1 hypothetical protein DMR_34500 [Solidesulfovibrio magneticus RS-1]